MTKILVIEDDDCIRENILYVLQAENFQTIGADNGLTGIQRALESLPDLIVCDVTMPELDGYGVLAALRQEPLTAAIPFIFLTALADKAGTRKGMELGADDYVTKPCSSEELLKAIAARLEKHAAIARKQSQKLDELRSNITLSLPHELRTPLNGILSFSELMLLDLESMQPEEIREMLEQIHSSGKRLYRLIQNFLMYAELELISTEPERIKELKNGQTVSTNSIITDAAISQAEKANRKADLRLHLQDGGVKMAAFRLTKLVEELVDNAFKFSEEGTAVALTSYVKNDKFILFVTNKGRGMIPQQIAEVGAYMQFDRKLYEQQGSGLGLAIAKRLAELHGGQLNLESVPNKETTIQVTLPAFQE